MTVSNKVSGYTGQAGSTSTVSNKTDGFTDQAASTSTVSNKTDGFTDQAASTSTVSNKVMDEIDTGIYLPASARAQVAGKSYTQPGGVQYQLSGVDQGVRRQHTNLINNDPPNAFVEQGSTPEISLYLQPGGDEARDLPEVGLLARIPGVDLTSAGSIPLLTTPGRSIVTLGCSVRVTNLAGLTSFPRAGVGFNATLDNVFAEQELTGLDATGTIYEFHPGGTSALAEPPLSTIMLGIDLAAVATTMEVEILLFGYVRRS